MHVHTEKSEIHGAYTDLQKLFSEQNYFIQFGTLGGGEGGVVYNYEEL